MGLGYAQDCTRCSGLRRPLPFGGDRKALFINDLRNGLRTLSGGYFWRNRCTLGEAEKRSYHVFGPLSQILDHSSLLRLPELIPPPSLFCGGPVKTGLLFCPLGARAKAPTVIKPDAGLKASSTVSGGFPKHGIVQGFCSS